MEKITAGLDVEHEVASIAFSWMRPSYFKDEETTMNGPVSFELLVASVERIARHAYYPGIDQAIELCLEDIDELLHADQITAEQRDALRLLLLGITVSTPSAASAA
jgi:hypothetical protein